MSEPETPSLNRTLIKVVGIYQDIITDMGKVFEVVSKLTDDRDILDLIIDIKQRSIDRLQVTQDLIDGETTELNQRVFFSKISDTKH